MSAKINKVDKLFLTRIPELFDGKGWHGKGTPTDEITKDIVAEVLFTHRFVAAGAIINGVTVETGEMYAVSNDNNLPIGSAVSTRYNTPSNKELFDLFASAIEGSAYRLASCGTVDSRNEFFIDAKGDNMRAGGRDIAPFVGLSRCFGGKSSIVTGGHTQVCQCANTTALMRREFGKREDNSTVKNTRNVMDKLPALKLEIEKQHGANADFAAALESACKVKVNRDDARNAFVGLLAEGKEKLEGARVLRTVNRVNRLLELFKTGAGNSGENLCDWFNAVTDYYSHENAGSVKDGEDDSEFRMKQWHASERGSGATIKSELATMLLPKGRANSLGFYKLRDGGRGIIEASAAEVVTDLN